MREESDSTEGSKPADDGDDGGDCGGIAGTKCAHGSRSCAVVYSVQTGHSSGIPV
jgi:hypothetical protein